MAWRFQPSKFKNIENRLCNQVKIDGPCKSISSVPANCAFSNLFSASGYLYSFLSDENRIDISSSFSPRSGSLASFHLNDLVDFGFSPFHDDVLGALSSSNVLRLYRVGHEPQLNQDQVSIVKKVDEELSSLDIDLNGANDDQARMFGFHPTIDSVAVVTRTNVIELYDVQGNNSSEPLRVCSSSTINNINSIDFEHQGRLVVASGRDPSTKSTCVCMFDLRVSKSTQPALNFVVDNPSKVIDGQSRVVYLDGPSIQAHVLALDPIVYGHNFMLWDTRSPSQTLSITPIDVDRTSKSPSVRLPLYDHDTGLLFLAIRGEPLLEHFEAEKLIKASYTSFDANRSKLDGKVLGAGLASKRCLDVMALEINRVVTLHPGFLQSCTFDVSRKSTTNFHEDLFPPTKSPFSALAQLSELETFECELNKTLSLDPASKLPKHRFGQNYYQLWTKKSEQAEDVEADAKKSTIQPKPAPKAIYNPKFGAGPKFKFLVGKLAPREEHFTDLIGLSCKIPQLMECLQANGDYALFPIGAEVNELAVVSLASPGKLNMNQIIRIRPCAPISYFGLHPNSSPTRVGLACHTRVLIFDLDRSLAAGTVLTVPDWTIECSAPAVLFQFHPQADGLMAIGLEERNSIQLHDYLDQGETCREEIELNNSVLSFAFNSIEPGGLKLAVLLKNGELWLIERKSFRKVGQVASEGSLKNGRLAWASSGDDDRFIVVTGFQGGQRFVYLLDSKAPSIEASCLLSYGLDCVSSSVLVPTFDHDTRTLFLTSRGDVSVHAFEIDVSPIESANRLKPLSNFDLPTPHQAVVFLEKSLCDVQKLEFARGFRLTYNSIEPFSFTLPRVHNEYFHDDVFPMTIDHRSGHFQASDWFTLNPRHFPKSNLIDLRPAGMQNYSEVKDELLEERNKKTRETKNGLQGAEKEDDSMIHFHKFADKFVIAEKCENLIAQTSNLVAYDGTSRGNAQLADVEGVDSDEWGD